VASSLLQTAGVDEIPFADETFDLVISLGVLHHIPDTAAALEKITKKAKMGGTVLIYLYYSFENRGALFKALHRLSELLRAAISRLPGALKRRVCDVIAGLVYFPLARLSYLFKMVLPGSNLHARIPLSFYGDRSFYVMRNDALDRFGTPLEQQFSRAEIRSMMEQAGVQQVKFSDTEPYWCAKGTRIR